MSYITLDRKKYDKDQIEQLQLGIDHGVDISLYSNPEYMALQMEWIRLGLEQEIDVSLYASLEYDWFQMEEIYRGIIGLIDISKYCDPSITYERMREIRKGLEQGIDLSPFIKYGSRELRELRRALKHGVHISKYIIDGYDYEQLEVIWKAIADGIEIEPYLYKEYRGVALNEIALGLRKKLNVEKYAKISYSWQQMREIREGLEERLDVDMYCSDLYSASQMHEIKLGLEAGLDVGSYRSLMYTAKEMRKKRLRLIEDMTGGSSIPMIPGNDGYYEYLFNIDKIGGLLLQSDGSVDFAGSYRYAFGKNNDVIAIYHEATYGKNGVGSDGRIIKTTKGKEKKILTGKGIYYNEKKKAYIAANSGWIYLDEEKDILEIRQVIRIDEVTVSKGHVRMSGNVEVLGNVEAGAYLEVDGDLIIDGHVSDATIICTGNIIIRNGLNGSKSEVVSEKSLICSYIENSKVVVKEDVRADYIFCSSVDSGGEVIVLGEKGTVIASVINAEKGIKCRKAGNDANASTKLIIVEPENVNKYEKILTQNKAKVLKELDILIKAREKRRKRFTVEERNNNIDFIKIENAIYTKNLELEKIDAEYEKLKVLKRHRGKPKITISDRIYAGVSFHIGKNIYETGEIIGKTVLEEVSGEIRVNIDKPVAVQ